MTDRLDALLDEQVAYYRAQAGEYDRAYTEHDTLDFRAAFVQDLPIGGDVLEFACGTGQWTLLLADRANTLTAVDAAREMLAVARQRLAGRPVEFVEADLFSWQPSKRYDTVFFAFWLSHVPPVRFTWFWDTVRATLAPNGHAIFVDDASSVRAIEHQLGDQPAPNVCRRLKDGSEHRIVKVFHEPGELTETLANLGWSATVRPVTAHFIAAVATPSQA